MANKRRAAKARNAYVDKIAARILLEIRQTDSTVEAILDCKISDARAESFVENDAEVESESLILNDNYHSYESEKMNRVQFPYIRNVPLN